MIQHVPALVILEINSKGGSILDRLESNGIEAVRPKPSENLAAAIKRVDPDVLFIDLTQPSESTREFREAVQTSRGALALPVLTLIDSNPGPADFENCHSFAADDFITAATSDGEICGRIHALSQLGHGRHQIALRDSFEELANRSPEGIITYVAEGEITYANPAAQAFFSSKISVGAQVFDLFASESRPLLQEAADSAVLDRIAPVPVRVKLAAPLNPCYEATATASRLNGDRKLLSLRLVNTCEELDDNLIVSQRLDVLGQLTGGLAHDLNNVLNAVIGGATLLEMDADNTLRPQIQTILTTAKRGGDLLQQLLLFSRGSDKAHEPTDLIDASRECASIVADSFPRNIEVRFKGPSNNELPEIEANAAQLHQIVMNLCVNARDGMPGGGELTITTGECHLSPQEIEKIDGAGAEGHYLTVSVKDSGTGIPAEIRSRIFEPFFSTKPKGKGTGLGLPTVVRLMQLHGGFVTLQSSTEIGTSVTCYFPCESPH